MELLVKLEIDETGAGLPRLAAGAPWAKVLPRALARIGKDPSSFDNVAVVITAIYPGNNEPTTPPDVTVSDFDDNLSDYVCSVLQETEWVDHAIEVNVIEQWRPDSPFRLLVEIHGRPVRSWSS